MLTKTFVTVIWGKGAFGRLPRPSKVPVDNIDMEPFASESLGFTHTYCAKGKSLFMREQRKWVCVKIQDKWHINIVHNLV
jgi:hypothetical protein